jgi:hypothetical protein
MIKLFYQTLLFIFASLVSVNAQVRIGSVDAPNKGAVLDLNADDTNTGSLGLSLPRVSLSNVKDWQLKGNNPVVGMMIYNVNSTVDEGVYVWMGTNVGWVALAIDTSNQPQPVIRPIKTMVIYTPAAKAYADKNGSINAFIDKALLISNNIMSNRNISAAYNLVHTKEINYTESSSSTNIDLNQLKNPNDGYLDDVFQWKATYNAEAVILLVDDVAPNIYSSGFLLNDNAGDPQSNFSIVKISSIPK